MNTVTISITRKSAFCCAAMPYRIKINQVEQGKLINGKSMSLDVPKDKMILTISVVGNSLNFHKIEKQIVLFPEHSKRGKIFCQIITKINILGVATLGLFQPIGRLYIEVSYD